MADTANKPTSVELTHPDSAQTIEVRPEQVDAYTSQGWRVKEKDAPAGNASLETWQAFARTKGFDDAELEGKTRDELRSALS